MDKTIFGYTKLKFTSKRILHNSLIIAKKTSFVSMLIINVVIILLEVIIRKIKFNSGQQIYLQEDKMVR